MNGYVREIYNSILSSIVEHIIGPGDKLPKEIDLAEQFGTNRMNAHRALKILADEGIVRSKKRVGTFICDALDFKRLKQLAGFAARRIMIMCDAYPTKVHWDESSFKKMEEILQPHGFDFTYCNIPDTEERSDLEKALEEIEEAGYGALVIFPDVKVSKIFYRNYDLVDKLKTPLYWLNRPGEASPFTNASEVSMDPLGEGMKVGSILKEEECRKLIFFTTEGHSFWSRKRYEGLKVGWAEDIENADIELLQQENHPRIAEIIAKIKSEPGEWTIVAVNNILSSLFIDAAAEKGVNVADHFQLITFDDNAVYLTYNLTTMAQPKEEVGEVFANMIFDNSWTAKYQGKISVKVSSSPVFRKTFVRKSDVAVSRIAG